MTKIYDVDSENIKIIPNKEMQNVVHMSAHLANVCLEYPICYEEDLERAEKLFIEELKKPDGRIPEIVGELSYLGVCRLGTFPLWACADWMKAAWCLWSRPGATRHIVPR